MSRKARQISITKIYHVILRGNDKQDIFYEDQDYIKFLKIIQTIQKKYSYEIYEYCLMTNHVHLIIYDDKNVLSKIMQSLSISYSLYFSKKYEKNGHLFQNRFLSKTVESQNYLYRLCRYIHQNPLKAKIAKTEEYKWSSYHEFISKAKIINPKPILSMFGQTKKESLENFIIYHHHNESHINDEFEYELVCKLTDTQLKEKIEKILNIKNVREIRTYDTKLRNEQLKKLEIIKGTSKSQISRVLGINKKIIQKILKNE